MLKLSIPPLLALKQLKNKIDNHEIDTWEYDNDGDFTHSVIQWKNIAWFHPIDKEDYLLFGILGRKDTKLSLMEYSVYHGRFTEMLLNNLSKFIVDLVITAPHDSKLDTDEIE